MDNDKKVIKSPYYSTEEITKYSDVLKRGLKDLGLSVDAFRSARTRLLAAIADTSYKCGQGFKDSIDEKFGRNSKEAEVSWVQVQYEFVFFFTHLAMRSALSKLGNERRIKLQDVLVPILADVTTEAWFGHWPEKLKEGIKNDFYTNMNTAELDYSECKGGLIIKDHPFSDDALFSRLAKNIARLSGYENNPAQIMLCITVCVDKFAEMNLDHLVESAGKEID